MGSRAKIRNRVDETAIQGRALGRAVRELARIAGIGDKKVRPHALALAGQPFDSFLLRNSKLFRRSRELYLGQAGVFEAALVSSPRTLGSDILLENRIEYSPIENELVWSATDPLQKKRFDHLLQIRTYSTSLFHEQNHRVLWRHLPPAPKSSAGLRRYLHLAESLVIAADMALGDELGPQLSRNLWLTGVTYDPGTDVRQATKSRRIYRNYLQACAYATYLHLELFDAEDIPGAIAALYPMPGNLAERAAIRAGNLDRSFIVNTNLFWQEKNRGGIRKALASRRGASLKLPDDPRDNRLHYLVMERWLDLLGL